MTTYIIIGSVIGAIIILQLLINKDVRDVRRGRTRP